MHTNSVSAHWGVWVGEEVTRGNERIEVVTQQKTHDEFQISLESFRNQR